MGYANSDSSTTSSQIGFPTYMPRRYWSYRPLSFSFTNMAVVNMTWDVPKGSKLWNNVLTRAVLDNWRLSDVTDFESGAPLTISFNTVSGTDLTGGGDGNRISVVSSPYLPKGQRTFARFFNPSAFALPPKGTVGNMGQGLLCGPGINNFNMALAKNFSALGEKLHFQLLFEGYNAFNHTQFSGVNTTGLFDANGNQVSPTFGQITTSRAPRNSQVSLRVTF
jgi:hypothetical protein